MIENPTISSTEEMLKREGIYFGQATIAGVPSVIGYIKKFRLSWMATQMNLFVVIGSSDKLIDKQTIESFSSAALEFALKNNKGWPRGVQAAVGSVAILQGSSMDNDAIAFCEKLTKKHWSAFEIPVLYNTVQKKAVRYRSNPMWGAIYFPFFSKTIDSITGKIG